MSSNCPPQLQLSLQPNTTSFKRSFEQFGFDLESPVDGGGGSANNGNDRNKRARSASSFSDSSDSVDGTLASGSNSSSSSVGGDEARLPEPTPRTLTTRASSVVPPRLPTPEIQDIEMPDYPSDTIEDFSTSLRSGQAPHGHNDERYRLSLERFNAFDSQISVLRQSRPTSPTVGRSPTPPPTLPPLSISDERSRLSLSTSAIPYLHPPPQPSTPLTEAFFGTESPSSTRVQSPTTVRDNSVYEEPLQVRDGTEAPTHQGLFRVAYRENLNSSPPHRSDSASSIRTLSSLNQDNEDLDPMSGFRAHLSGALERLRPQSPLVPGLGLDGQEDEEDHVVAPTENNPPTLPPIPSVVSDADIEDLLVASSTNTEAPNSAAGSYPVPSPSLRDFHSWMSEERGPLRSADATVSSTHPEDFTPWFNTDPLMRPNSLSTMNPTPNTGNRLRADEDAVRALDAGVFSGRSVPHRRRPSGAERAEGSSSMGVMEDMGLWERRSFELWNNSNDDSADNDPHHISPSPSSPLIHSQPRRRLSPDPETSRRRSQPLQPRTWTRSYAQTRLGSSNSLVTENALEARRRADHADLLRSVYSTTGATSREESDVEMQFGDENPGSNMGDSAHLDELSAVVDGRIRWNEMRPERRMRALMEEQARREDLYRRQREETSRLRRRMSSEQSNLPFILPLPLPSPSLNVVSSPDEGEDDSFFGVGEFGRSQGTYAPHFIGGRNSQIDEHQRRQTLRHPLHALQRLQSTRPMDSPRRNSSADLIDFSHTHSPTTRQWPQQFPQPSTQPTQRRPLLLPLFSSLFDGHAHGFPETPSAGHATADTPSENTRRHSRSLSAGTVSLDSIDEERNRFRAAILGRHPWTLNNEPPSLPPPDLGSTFEAGEHDANPSPNAPVSHNPEVVREASEPPSFFAPTQHRIPPVRTAHSYTTSRSTTSTIDRHGSRPDSDPAFHAHSWQQPPNPSLIRVDPTQYRWLMNSARPDTVDSLLERRHQVVQGQDVGHSAPLNPSSVTASGISTGSFDPFFSDDISGAHRGSFAYESVRHVDRSTYPLNRPPPNPSISSRRPSYDDNGQHSAFMAPNNRDNQGPQNFAPGPFRNTMNQLLSHRSSTSQVSVPPSIPPLSFEEPSYQFMPRDLQALHSTPNTFSEAPARRNSVHSHLDDDVPPDTYDLIQQARAALNPEVPFRSSGGARSSAVMNQGSANHNTSGIAAPERIRRSQAEIHMLLTQRVRMEPSRLENPDASREPSLPTGQNTTRASRTTSTHIDPLHPGASNAARQQQLIQQRDNEIRRRASFRSDAQVSEGNVASNMSRGHPPPRRMGPSDVNVTMQNVRQRQRYHARLRPEFGASRIRPGALGDYMLDDDFEAIRYEGLLSLAESIGDAKPKATPAEILERLEKSTFKDWKTDDGDTRCPICLDDYNDDDQLLKLNNCSHWLHQECLQQWLQTANTCPVCRKSVHEATSSSSSAPHRHFHYHFHPRHPPVHPPAYHPLGRGPPPPPPPGASGTGASRTFGDWFRGGFE